MSAVAMESIVSRAEGFSTAAVREELMMLNVEHGSYYSLDPIGAEIWRMLEQPARVQDLVEGLQKRYNVSAEQCAEDVLAFLGEMQQNGMIVVT